MFNFKKALEYKIEMKRKYHLKKFDTYEKQKDKLLNDGFIKSEEKENEYYIIQDLSNTHNIRTIIEIKNDQDGYLLELSSSNQYKKSL